MGLPCGHDVMKLLKSDPPGVIKLEDINPHWRYVKPAVTAEGSIETHEEEVIDPLFQIIDPLVIKTKGRPSGSRNKRKIDAHARSTHRDPSGFEYMEGEFAATQEATQESSTQGSRPAKRRQRGRPRGEGPRDEDSEM